MLKKEKNESSICFKTQLKLRKTSYSFNDSKLKRTMMDLSCSKKLSELLKGK